MTSNLRVSVTLTGQEIQRHLSGRISNDLSPPAAAYTDTCAENIAAQRNVSCRGCAQIYYHYTHEERKSSRVNAATMRSLCGDNRMHSRK